jgi:hypothetical protein
MDAASVEMAEGTGGQRVSSALPRALALFLQWVSTSGAQSRFDEFFDRCTGAVVGAGDNNSDSSDDEEHSLAAHDAFLQYELFFEVLAKEERTTA